MPDQGIKVFLSYTRDQSEIAEQIRSGLISRGFHVWMDAHAPAGAEVSGSVHNALDAADAFVVLVSKRSLTSSFFVFEVARAIAIAEQRRLRIIPIITERGAVVPPFLARYLYIDLTDRTQLENALNRIAIGIVDQSRERETHDEQVVTAQRDIDEIVQRARQAAVNTELQMKEAELHLAQVIAKASWAEQKAAVSLQFARWTALGLIIATVTATAPLIFPFVRRLLAETPYVLFIGGAAIGSVLTLAITTAISRRHTSAEKGARYD